jgi:hypothetical protein
MDLDLPEEELTEPEDSEFEESVEVGEI